MLKQYVKHSYQSKFARVPLIQSGQCQKVCSLVSQTSPWHIETVIWNIYAPGLNGHACCTAYCTHSYTLTVPGPAPHEG